MRNCGLLPKAISLFVVMKSDITSALNLAAFVITIYVRLRWNVTMPLTNHLYIVIANIHLKYILLSILRMYDVSCEQFFTNL